MICTTICCRRSMSADERGGSIAIAIVCKTPAVGGSKTRLSPPLSMAECAQLSACFIADLGRTLTEVAQGEDAVAYALYTPRGSEPALRMLLPAEFPLLPQVDGDFGARLQHGVRDLLALGHAGAILVNSDSPTLPAGVLRQAVAALRGRDAVVLGPALDGGYTLIGLAAPHPELFVDVSWSTPAVFEQTLARARTAGLPVTVIDGWYDVDDASSLAMLERELAGVCPPITRSLATSLQPAAQTREFLQRRDPSQVLG